MLAEEMEGAYRRVRRRQFRAWLRIQLVLAGLGAGLCLLGGLFAALYRLFH
jgi:hypothetical protein